ncbi:MAG: phosphotransferase [Planctomycetes bacterium]|nr:phosphotransferase [Planctomycetota bacterium]
MPRLPWDSDASATAENFARRVGFDSAARLVKVGEGWDNAVFRGPRGLLYRFSKRRGEFPFLKREARLLRLLDGRLPLAIPRVVSEGTGFMAYRPVTGRFLAEMEPTRSAVLSVGAGIGKFVSALRAVDVQRRRIPVVLGTPRGQRREALGWLKRLGHGFPGVRALLDRLPAPFEGAPVLSHNDLLPEHILVRRGRPSGVIDWADAGLGDPAADFVGLAMWGGRRALEAALWNFTHPVDPGLPERVAYYALCVGLSEIHYGVFGDRPECVRWGKRAVGWVVRGE